MAELRQQTLATLGGVAAIIAVGGLAVLCGAAATAGEPGGAAPAAGPAFSQEPCSVCSQRGWRPSTLGDGSKITCNICGGERVHAAEGQLMPERHTLVSAGWR